MAEVLNKIARPVTNVPDYLVGTVKVPVGETLYPGNILVADSVDATINGNWSVFAATKPVTANLGKTMAIVINGGWEHLPDGRRPEGNSDYTQYKFDEGEVVTIVFLATALRFEISKDALTTGATLTVGEVLYPTNDAWTLTEGTSVPTSTVSYLKILANKYFRLGGQFGGEFAPTVIVIAGQSITVTP
jgi:hypothetical protein